MNDFTLNKPHLIDAVAGNGRMLASLGRTGRLYRLWWPHVDFPQHVDEIRTGLKLDHSSSGTVWFDADEDGWQHRIEYVPHTNIVQVRAEHPSFPLAVEQSDYAVPDQDFMVRSYKIDNRSAEPLSFTFVWYASFRIAESALYNTTLFDETNDAMVHYRHRYFFAVGSDRECVGFQCGSSREQAEHAWLNGNDIDMQPDGALVWRIEDLQPGESFTLPVYIAAGHNRPEALGALAHAKSRSVSEWFERTTDYWHQYLRDANRASAGVDPAIADAYERSLLTFRLMADERTGSLLAAPEPDEQFSRCGGYAYCWGRDAAFITTALNKSGLSGVSEKFYEWALSAQEPDGSWQQRHYHDGSLAPSWGLQIDEGASVIWGMWQLYEQTRDAAFAERMWPAVAKGAAFLAGYIDEETGLPLPSMDLWEERKAEHTYSAAAVCGGLRAAASFAELMEDAELAGRWREIADRIAASIESLCWNESAGSFYRGLKLKVDGGVFAHAVAQGSEGSAGRTAKGYEHYELRHDPIVDISLLGVSVPFGVLPAEHPYMQRTADTIARLLHVEGVGGIKRYENDGYIGGNPWILTTLWLAQYRVQNGQLAEAGELLRWACEHRTETGLLPEQIDRVTGEPAWIVPLTWSHAMFVLTVSMLAEAGYWSGKE
ncbi:glycoside hydrolase family 15 protein [Cohnella sp. GbtcB17]|uniref:glycoside hydrolase family 15 protein n=1 Tax=Cohnella sp. GbtcB17 TaxID=2824762 RepID=UPI0027D21948|nr:glycoside hydrolase family 15 protein [Cohnella sp. GbtcB17]